jgi:hypothetical protein
MRDGCVRAGLVALDPYCHLAVFARCQTIETAVVRYEMVARPTERDFSIRRYCGGDVTETADTATVLPYTHCEFIAPERTMNIVEMRTLGPTLQAWINGRHVASVHDPALGCGSFGLMLGTSKEPVPPDPRRILCQWVEVREVTT